MEGRLCRARSDKTYTKRGNAIDARTYVAWLLLKRQPLKNLQELKRAHRKGPRIGNALYEGPFW
ncbi:hypothetical protein GCWU000325_00678 [Alloprevotella tannerae ATCC 51259]|uniref:Uncharacterized protein n=1 Tax=Alloprevotella tannerae ATCC 51259 TaxID=626522 RepID=C9LEP8_9BACT|nr:hypothetical protein GCWU000325_00678 [Alloprevotella tannerae ATCC 51259]